MTQSSERQDGSLSNAQASPNNMTFADMAEVIVESLPTGIVAFDSNLRIIRANTRAKKLIDIEEYIDRSLNKGSDPKIFNDWTSLLKSSIAAKDSSDFNSVRYNFNGHKSLLHIVCTPINTQQHKGGVLTLDDISKNADIEHQLARAEKLAAVGKVAQKVAHELNNPLDGILRYINLTERVIEQGNILKAKEYIDRSRDGLMRMVNIIHELLQFSRNTYTAFEEASVDRVISDVIKIMEPVVKNVEIRIIHNSSWNKPLVRANSLFQVFCNLIKYAVDAMHGTGMLTITTTQLSNNIKVEFKDTGPGFAPENTEKIFQPFFTTKPHSKGTGLGLAICKDIVESLNGNITAQNSPQGGSIFTVYLPVNRYYAKTMIKGNT